MKRWQWFFKRKPPYLWEDRPIVRQKAQRKYDIRFIWFAWAITVILALGFGIYARHKVTAAYKDAELMDVRAALETANASLAEANVELEFWQTTIKGLAEGRQLEGAELNGRPSLGD